MILWWGIRYTVKTGIIGYHAGTLELPLLVRSAVSGGGESFAACFLPLIQRGNSRRPSAMPNYFGFYGIGFEVLTDHKSLVTEGFWSKKVG